MTSGECFENKWFYIWNIQRNILMPKDYWPSNAYAMPLKKKTVTLKNKILD